MLRKLMNRWICLAAGATMLLAGPAFAQELQLTNSGACPGVVTLSVSNATPGGRVGFAYGRDPGLTPVPNCPGLVVDLNAARLAGVATADANGNASLSGTVVEPLCGSVLAQAVDVATCRKSNVEVVGTETLILVPGGFGPNGGGPDGNQYCRYQLVKDCPALGLRALDTICVLCENQNHQARCTRHRSKRVSIRFSQNCDQRICDVLAIGEGGCADCPSNVPPNRYFRHCD